MPNALNGVYPDGSCQLLEEDGERVSRRGWRAGGDGNRSAMLVVLPAAEHPSPSSLDHLGLKDELGRAWGCGRWSLCATGTGQCWCSKMPAASRSTGYWACRRA